MGAAPPTPDDLVVGGGVEPLAVVVGGCCLGVVVHALHEHAVLLVGVACGHMRAWESMDTCVAVRPASGRYDTRTRGMRHLQARVTTLVGAWQARKP